MTPTERTILALALVKHANSQDMWSRALDWAGSPQGVSTLTGAGTGAGIGGLLGLLTTGKLGPALLSALLGGGVGAGGGYYLNHLQDLQKQMQDKESAVALDATAKDHALSPVGKADMSQFEKGIAPAPPAPFRPIFADLNNFPEDNLPDYGAPSASPYHRGLLDIANQVPSGSTAPLEQLLQGAGRPAAPPAGNALRGYAKLVAAPAIAQAGAWHRGSQLAGQGAMYALDGLGHVANWGVRQFKRVPTALRQIDASTPDGPLSPGFWKP